jgi:hypothetical protein
MPALLDYIIDEQVLQVQHLSSVTTCTVCSATGPAVRGIVQLCTEHSVLPLQVPGLLPSVQTRSHSDNGSLVVSRWK